MKGSYKDDCMSSFEYSMQQRCCQSCQQVTLSHFFSYLRTKWNKAVCMKCSLLFFRVTLVSKLYSSGLSSGHSPRCYLATSKLKTIACMWSVYSVRIKKSDAGYVASYGGYKARERCNRTEQGGNKDTKPTSKAGLGSILGAPRNFLSSFLWQCSKRFCFGSWNATYHWSYEKYLYKPLFCICIVKETEINTDRFNVVS